MVNHKIVLGGYQSACSYGCKKAFDTGVACTVDKNANAKMKARRRVVDRSNSMFIAVEFVSRRGIL